MIDSAWLSARQNPDGGWPYVTGGSAVEPTAWALLSLAALGAADSDPGRRGAAWLARLQRSDGGWPPRPNVAESTWVTALVLLLPGNAGRAQAAAWLLGQTGRESSLVQRVRMALMGIRSEVDVSSDGWPWFPGAAAWVMPTSVTLLALRKMQTPAAAHRIRSGEKFLLGRMCADGGWNHGASKALGYEAGSYPETTGMALLALSGTKLTRSLDTAERHLATTRSREAASWLQLGLLAHGRRPAEKQFPSEPRTVHEAAISTLAGLAMTSKKVL